MQSNYPATYIRPGAKGSTETVAALFNAKAQTPRRSYCLFGQWMGMVPTKLPNGRLLWDLDEACRLLHGEPVKPDAAAIRAHHERKAAADPAKLPKHIARKVAAKAKRLATANSTADADKPLPSGEVAK